MHEAKRISGPPNAWRVGWDSHKWLLGRDTKKPQLQQLFHTESLGPFTLDDFALLNQCTLIPKVEVKMSPRKRRNVFMTCKETTGLGGKYMSFDCPKNGELYPAEKMFSTSFGLFKITRDFVAFLFSKSVVNNQPWRIIRVDHRIEWPAQ